MRFDSGYSNNPYYYEMSPRERQQCERAANRDRVNPDQAYSEEARRIKYSKPLYRRSK